MHGCESTCRTAHKSAGHDRTWNGEIANHTSSRDCSSATLVLPKFAMLWLCSESGRRDDARQLVNRSGCLMSFLSSCDLSHYSYLTFPCCLCPGVPFAFSTELPLAIVHPAGRDSKIESTCSETRFSRSESRASIFEGPSHLRPTYHECAARETLSKRLAVE